MIYEDRRIYATYLMGAQVPLNYGLERGHLRGQSTGPVRHRSCWTPFLCDDHLVHCGHLPLEHFLPGVIDARSAADKRVHIAVKEELSVTVARDLGAHARRRRRGVRARLRFFCLEVGEEQLRCRCVPETHRRVQLGFST